MLRADRLVFGDDQAEGLCDVLGEPWWGQSWTAISKVRAGRVWVLEAWVLDLERVGAMVVGSFILPRGPLAHRQLVSLGAA